MGANNCSCIDERNNENMDNSVCIKQIKEWFNEEGQKCLYGEAVEIPKYVYDKNFK